MSVFSKKLLFDLLLFNASQSYLLFYMNISRNNSKGKKKEVERNRSEIHAL